jgi:thiol-disulfide isomerase/thioredoxin
MNATARTTEDRYEFLLDCGVLVEESEDRLAASEAYDAERGVYHDTYGDASDTVFRETIASLFDMTVEEARERIEELGITRAQLVAYLSLKGYFKRQAPDHEVSKDELLHLATLVAGVSPTSPVPDEMEGVDDNTYEEFLEVNGDSVLFVWKLHCEPCDRMKDDLDAILEAVPDGVAVAGVDGESVAEFRREFDVDAAPATLTFTDGEFVESRSGRQTPEQLAELFAATFGADRTD